MSSVFILEEISFSIPTVVFLQNSPENLPLTLVLLLLHQLSLDVKHSPGKLPVDDNVRIQKTHSLSSEPHVFVSSQQIFHLDCLCAAQEVLDDGELADESVEKDGLVVVGVGRSKLIVRAQLKSNHQAFHLWINLQSKSSKVQQLGSFT